MLSPVLDGQKIIPWPEGGKALVAVNFGNEEPITMLSTKAEEGKETV